MTLYNLLPRGGLPSFLLLYVHKEIQLLSKKARECLRGFGCRRTGANFKGAGNFVTL